MNRRIALLVQTFELLPLEARDGIIDAVEAHIVRVQGETRRPALRIGLGLMLSVITHLRRMSNTPDDDVDQANPV
jgi:hypothetical protein